VDGGDLAFGEIREAEAEKLTNVLMKSAPFTGRQDLDATVPLPIAGRSTPSPEAQT
jgi:hypothetical protein